MVIKGVDYHPSDQYIAFVDTETGENGERRLNHSDGEAEKFYRELTTRGVSVRVGMEATGYSRWFERLLAELGIEVWIGEAAKIKAKRVRKRKTDRQDAQLLLKWQLENVDSCCPRRIGKSIATEWCSRDRSRETRRHRGLADAFAL
jgi:transposase